MRAVVAATVLAGCGGAASKPVVATKLAEPVAHRTRTIPVADPESEDGVELVSTRGRVDPNAVAAALTPHRDDLSDCYTSRVGSRRWLGGRVVLHWDINKYGEVTAVKLADSDLGAWPVEKCLLEVARAATFAKPIGGDADFAVPLEFTARGRAAIWDETKGLRAVGGQIAKLDQCARAKGVKGAPRDVTITLYVGPQGKAESVGFSSPQTVLDDAWVGCAETVAMAWRLPDPRGSVAKLAVRYRR